MGLWGCKSADETRGSLLGNLCGEFNSEFLGRLDPVLTSERSLEKIGSDNNQSTDGTE